MQLSSSEIDLFRPRRWYAFIWKKGRYFFTSSEFYAGKYSGQLKLYVEMQSVHSPNPVTRKLIYYVIQGVIIEI